ncbi:MAG: Thiol-disulfide isomerase [Parcubacteria group bacterium Gr01-1014_20]|nr:MAG: Thiol-disulfide isomerase [Parcubacteria group bacterium Gr01-1014_20]
MGNKKILLPLVVIAIMATILYLDSGKIKPSENLPKDQAVTPCDLANSSKYECYHEISTPDGFLNTPSVNPGQLEPITIGELVGKKVILVDFWTYTCINCQRTLPYLNAWYEKYEDEGLEIIGIHTPEFEFEKKYENVKAAVDKFKIKYPVVLDNDFSTWNAYQNRFWPRKYLIDIRGNIIYDHIGEGGYEETEKKIQEALKERMSVLGVEGELPSEIGSPKGVTAVDPSRVGSPEVYFGAARNEFLGNGKKGVVGDQAFGEPEDFKRNILFLVGNWNIKEESAENKTASAKIIFKYSAKNVYMVAGSEKGAKLKIINDGKEVNSLIVKEEVLYPIIENSTYGEHLLEIIIENPGLIAFTFTFG